MNIEELIEKNELELTDIYKEIDKICRYNSKKVLEAFHKNQVSESHFNSTTGYGYNDEGRDTIEKVFADVFKCEDALVRSQFISGTHALTVCLFGLLRPKDILLSISGKPYDTLDSVIGIKDNPSSLKSFGIEYRQIDLIDNEFDTEKILDTIKNNKIKVITIQRSKGYSTRKSIGIDKIRDIIKKIKEVDSNVIIMIDNCYCEFVDYQEPTEVGADIMVGSLIKNLGGGIAPNGAYIAGKKDLVELVAERLTVPSQGKEVGPSLGLNKAFLQGLYMAPSVVAASVKTATLLSKVLDNMNIDTEPKYNEKRADIVLSIIFRNRDKLIKFVQSIQESSAIDAYVKAMPSPMPGYDDEVIMASGSFTQGSSIELSADGPLREPYIAYFQGSLTYEYGRIAVMNAVKRLMEDNNE